MIEFSLSILRFYHTAMKVYPILSTLIVIVLTALSLPFYGQILAHVNVLLKSIGKYNKITAHIIAIFIYVLVVMQLGMIAAETVLSSYYTPPCERRDYYDQFVERDIVGLKEYINKCSSGRYVSEARSKYTTYQYEATKTCIRRQKCSALACVKIFSLEISDGIELDELLRLAKEVSDVQECRLPPPKPPAPLAPDPKPTPEPKNRSVAPESPMQQPGQIDDDEKDKAVALIAADIAKNGLSSSSAKRIKVFVKPHKEDDQYDIQASAAFEKYLLSKGISISRVDPSLVMYVHLELPAIISGNEAYIFVDANWIKEYKKFPSFQIRQYVDISSESVNVQNQINMLIIELTKKAFNSTPVGG